MSTYTRARVGAAVALACLSFPLMAAADTPDLDTVATQTLATVIGATDCLEHAGVIIQTATGYRATAPVAGNEGTFTLHVKLYTGETLAAIYHTHTACGEAGSKPTVGYFSVPDVAMAKQLRVPSYIGISASREVRKWAPGMPTQLSDGPAWSSATGVIAHGVRVGAVP